MSMAVTEEEVLWCYRALLRREPETAEIVKLKMSLEKDFRSLLLGFLNSQEYLREVAAAGFVALDRNAIQVDTTASPLELSLVKDRIRETWSQLGLDRPHDSILSGADYQPENIDEESIERFYATGLEEAAIVEAVLGRFGFAQSKTKVCVEYGCGVGRVTFALAAMFEVVHAYDISANHLRLAQQHATEFGVGNVEFHLCAPDTVSDALVPCDFYYSRLVFQHNPPPLIRELVSAALNALRPGGIAIFQVPTYGLGYSFSSKEYVANPRCREIEMHCFPQHELFALIASLHCILLEVNQDTAVGRYGEWISNTFVVQRPALTSLATTAPR
jgi:SAM-dependent methyltransferase